MNRGIYSTATGMVAAQRWMDVTANNLANASTNGFKRDGLLFNDAMQRSSAPTVASARASGSIGTGAVPQAEYTVFERGSLTMTSNPLDMAIENDKGMFAVQTGRTPRRSSTRGTARSPSMSTDRSSTRAASRS